MRTVSKTELATACLVSKRLCSLCSFGKSSLAHTLVRGAAQDAKRYIACSRVVEATDGRPCLSDTKPSSIVKTRAHRFSPTDVVKNPRQYCCHYRPRLVNLSPSAVKFHYHASNSTELYTVVKRALVALHDSLLESVHRL